MTSVDLVVFSTGWLLGWLLLWRTRPLPSPIRPGREPLAAIVPARNEARSIGMLVDRIVPQLQPGDEFVVVDDQSDDGTAELARTHGARVVPASPTPGWLGKPHACQQGVDGTMAPTLLFIDADVLPSTRLLDDIAPVVQAHPNAVVSVQPWHRTDRWYEQASILGNVVTLMGSGAFTVLGERVHPNVAFGPVLAMRRRRYDEIGGHEAVRGRHTEDIGLARLAGGAVLFTGRPDMSFRMYPDGWRQLVDGWTRTIATGLRSTRWWVAIGVVWWIAALAGGWLAGGLPVHDPWQAGLVYLLCALQCWVLGRRAGSLHPVTAALFPLAVAVFVLIVARSIIVAALGRDVVWKGRRVDARSG
jgi:4,4'-diaponeurosporenoate glycosyltransferase